MAAQGIEIPPAPTPDIYVAAMGESEAVISLTHALRRKGIHAMCDLDSKSLKAQMKNADRMGAKYSVVIGGDEISAGKVKIKNMESGDTAEISLTAEDITLYINREDK